MTPAQDGPQRSPFVAPRLLGRADHAVDALAPSSPLTLARFFGIPSKQPRLQPARHPTDTGPHPDQTAERHQDHVELRHIWVSTKSRSGSNSQRTEYMNVSVTMEDASSTALSSTISPIMTLLFSP